MDFKTYELFTSLVSSAKIWVPLTKREAREFWQNEGDLVEHWGISSPRELHKSQLSIPPEHALGLKSFEEEIVELYNFFDIWLKEKYKMNVVDFIDYDGGIVVLIKPVKYSL